MIARICVDFLHEVNFFWDMNLAPSEEWIHSSWNWRRYIFFEILVYIPFKLKQTNKKPYRILQKKKSRNINQLLFLSGVLTRLLMLTYFKSIYRKPILHFCVQSDQLRNVHRVQDKFTSLSQMTYLPVDTLGS